MGKIIKETKKIAGQEKMHLYLTDEEMMKLDEEFIRNQSFNEGIQEGIQEGTLSEKKNVIFNMLKKKFSLDTIAECVNLDVSDVKRIIETPKD